MKKRYAYTGNVLITLGILILIALEYFLHHKNVFVMDDLWYSTNLATGEPLQSFSDIIQSQVWHFYNWGGRNITHGILQLTLISGETIANVLNLIMVLLLSLMICIISNYKKPLTFLLSMSLLITFNPNIVQSMFWQSGTVNYVYSTAWILIFLWIYLRETKECKANKIPLINIWIIPLGLISGWSNENMGPASFIISVSAIFYIWKYLKQKPPVWMYLGSAFSLIGSGLVILAPGNFVRTNEIPETDLLTTISERLLNMLRAGVDYLFPSIAFLLIILFIYVAALNHKLKPFQWLLLLHGVLSYGAMLLSPHYPDRATFGTMCVFITLAISMLGEISEQKKEGQICINLIALCSWIYSVYTLIFCIYTR